MKKALWIFMLLLIGGLISSCNKSDIEYENDFDKSQKALESFKESSNNSYRYKVVYGSWTGLAGETIITVTKGKVTQRHFKYTGSDKSLDQTPRETVEWTENEGEINSHLHDSAAEGRTLDEVYEQAKNNWLTKRKNARILFENKNDGMISTCGYIEDGCQDDCFTGISIEYIEAI